MSKVDFIQTELDMPEVEVVNKRMTKLEFSDLIDKYEDVDKVFVKLEKKRNELKNEIKEYMIEEEVKNIDTAYAKYTIVEESVSVRFDAKELKKEIPELYKRYAYNSYKKSYLSVNNKKGK